MQFTNHLLAVCVAMQSIQSLMLDDLKLKTDLNVLLSALGSNTTLTELDITYATSFYSLSFTAAHQTYDREVTDFTDQVVSTTWISDCLWTGKPSQCVTSTKVNSAFHPSGVGESSDWWPSGWGYGVAHSPVSSGRCVILYGKWRLDSFQQRL